MKKLLLIGLIILSLGSCRAFIRANYGVIDEYSTSSCKGFCWYSIKSYESEDALTFKDTCGKYQVGDTVKFVK